ncbi:TetR/AcrR family transcriptional regulator [Methylorubrum sp. SL192]|uniref:TetR/AcrR family transcriptional regulator n=1 Tax=Methylorubrum sp. SL192 TaxID=2995167 RepID=UPI0022729E34|nr:TetR/AcrR family transcriptional regulator [Methylorubrum sp. SL192]MCY1640535.1 TetR/AcrR family transcriptional regulator [Methylorubrum sp. SL192]
MRQFDDEIVIRQALDLFWQQGPASTSMLNLAQATSVQRGSLYNAFGDRETIFIKAFSLYSENLIKTSRESLNGLSAKEKLENFFDLIITNMTLGIPSRGCLTTKTAIDGSLANDKILHKVRELVSSLEFVVAQSFTGFEDQLLLPPPEAASLVVVFTRGLAVMERIHGSSQKLRRSASQFVQCITRSSD